MADKAMLDNLTKLASRFRLLIEETDLSDMITECEKFPYGSCGDASILLAQYLIDAGCDLPTYVVGEIVEPTRLDPTNLRSHAWLELGGYVLDITGDGFGPNIPSVIVTDNSDWHDQFKRFDEHPVAIHLYDDWTASRLSAAYEEIIGLRVH